MILMDTTMWKTVSRIWQKRYILDVILYF